MKNLGCLAAMALAFCAPLHAENYYVAIHGDDSNPGTREAPLRHIQCAAQKAMPGDTVIVSAGVYRERIDPPRGGDSAERRIVYKAAPGERVVITGSEPADHWSKVNGDTWKITLPNSFFGESNPFDELLYGTWYYTKQPNHVGSVYFNGKMMKEAGKLKELLEPTSKNIWYTEADGNGGPIVMNLDWIRTEGGRPYTSENAVVEGGDPAVRIDNATRPWPFGYLKHGSVLHYENIDFGAGTQRLEIEAATMAKNGTVEIHMDNTSGELLGRAVVTNTGDWLKFSTFTAQLCTPVSGTHNLALVIQAPPPAINGKTTIWARFPTGTDPNNGSVEVSVRPKVFYPSKTGCNYITVSGFILENAACNFASPSAEQPGLIGPRWAKGWIIENNTIRNARCSGISLGRPTYGHSHHASLAYGVRPKSARIYPEVNCGQTEKQLANYFDTMSWTKDEAGFHVVRNNQIYDCGQAGIVGCSGGAFSLIEGNDIHDICVNETFTGCEMAAIKLHFAIDTIIRNNHLYSSSLGLWLDWGAQGAIVEGNLFNDNDKDIFLEVSHGPTLFLNNLLFSGRSETVGTHGSAWVHNLIAQNLDSQPTVRNTPVKTFDNTQLGDWRYINNVIAANSKLDNPFAAFKKTALPVTLAGNIILGKSSQINGKPSNVILPEVAPPKLIRRGNEWFVTLKSEPMQTATRETQREQVTTKNLGVAIIPQQEFTKPDGSPIVVDTDYFGKTRDASNPTPGPFAQFADEIKVWPK